MAIKHGSKVDKSYSAASMTDLMFLLLMFMLIATTLINPNALKLLLPKSANQIKEKPYTSVSITADLRYYVEDQPIPFPALEGALQSKLAGKDEPMVSLHCDRTVPVDEVVKVMNIAKDNNYKLILATSPN
ncbi:MAG: biopolymer transporter ExbD [Rikenellaceae bacterium]|jgi:biopolymer transport protein ExbD|nr:biopolymer transporter ExbD [Rikenellaceae bacterium]